MARGKLSSSSLGGGTVFGTKIRAPRYQQQQGDWEKWRQFAAFRDDLDKAISVDKADFHVCAKMERIAMKGFTLIAIRLPTALNFLTRVIPRVELRDEDEEILTLSESP